MTINGLDQADPAARVRNFEQSKAQFDAIWKKAEETGATKAVSLNFKDAFFGARGVAADEQ